MEYKWDEIIKRAVDFRRTLHRNPELAWREHETSKMIRNLLDEFEIRWASCADTGTIVRLGADKAGTHIAFRADIDGLAITEKTTLQCKSECKERMHACGHDGHTAVLIAAALWLKQNEPLLQGPVSLLFQPAEEGGHGAKRMIEEGALEGVDEIYGWHNWPAIPFGKAVLPDRTVMASNGVFKIILSGRGGHSSQPESCRDPVLAASAVTIALQQIVSRRLPPQKAGVVSVTSIDAASGETTIPDQTILSGTVRAEEERLRAEIAEYISEIAEDTASSYGVKAKTLFTPRYGAVKNHKENAEKYRAVIDSEFPGSTSDTDIPVPIMASEDFSYYLNEIPGAFALIGADDGKGTHYPCHSSRYRFNERLIEHMAAVFTRLAGLKI